MVELVNCWMVSQRNYSRMKMKTFEIASNFKVDTLNSSHLYQKKIKKCFNQVNKIQTNRVILVPQKSMPAT